MLFRYLITLAILFSVNLSSANNKNAEIYLSTNTNISCEESKEIKEIPMYSFMKTDFLLNKKWGLIPSSLGCVNANKSYSVVDESGEKIAEALVIRTILLDLFLPYKSVAQRVRPKNYVEVARVLFNKEFRAKDRLISIRFDVSRTKLVKEFKVESELKESHHFIKKTLNKKEFQEAMKNKWLVLDVRSGKEYINNKIKFTRLLPYQEKSPIFLTHGEVLHSSDLKSLFTAKFKVSSIESYKTKPVVVFGAHKMDPRPLRALAKLNIEGFADLYWYKGGVDDFKNNGLVYEVSYESNGVDSIDHKAVKEKIKKKETLFIDVRMKKIDGIYNAVELPYMTEDRYVYFPEGKAPIHFGEFKNRGDKFDLRKIKGLDKQQEIVIYGEDKMDWRPLRAALWLKAEGYNEVSVYAGGSKAWYNNYNSSKDRKRLFDGSKEFKASRYRKKEKK